MTSISSLSSAFINPKTSMGSYERNEKAFGPVTASVIGAADAISSAASSTYSFSSEALDRLSSAVGHGVDAVTSTIGEAADAVENVAHGAMDAVGDAVGSVGDAVASVGHVGSEIVEGVGDALGHLGSYAATAGLAIGNALDLTV